MFLIGNERHPQGLQVFLFSCDDLLFSEKLRNRDSFYNLQIIIFIFKKNLFFERETAKIIFDKVTDVQLENELLLCYF